VSDSLVLEQLEEGKHSSSLIRTTSEQKTSITLTPQQLAAKLMFITGNVEGKGAFTGGLFSRGTSRFQFAHSVDPVLKQGEADFDRK